MLRYIKMKIIKKKIKFFIIIKGRILISKYYHKLVSIGCAKII